jgi:hypothetical protein
LIKIFKKLKEDEIEKKEDDNVLEKKKKEYMYLGKINLDENKLLKDIKNEIIDTFGIDFNIRISQKKGFKLENVLKNDHKILKENFTSISSGN